MTQTFTDKNNKKTRIFSNKNENDNANIKMYLIKNC